MTQDETRGRRGTAAAVVASASASEAAEVQQMLRSGGLTGTITAAGDDLLDEVLSFRPDILVVDLEIALTHAESLPEIIAQHRQLAGLPVILLLPDAGVGQLPEGLLPYVSDIVFRPLTAAELVHRVRAAVTRRRRRQSQRAASARLREDMRRISAGIRATNDPTVMVGDALPAVGRALGAHHVALQLFDDERIAAQGSSWTAGEARVASYSTPSTDDDAAFAVARSLWEETAAATFDSDAAPASRSGAAPVPAWIRLPSDRTVRVSGAVAALGEGAGPFGLLWIVAEDTDLAWSGVESALTQHVLGNLAHGLIQAQLISTQQQAVRKLHALNKAKSDFVGTVNHELRTPLASITGYLEMIIDGVGGELPPEASTMLHAVERNTAKLSRLIENISALSSREDDLPAHEPVDIVHLVSELTSRSVLQASAGGILLDCVLPDRPITVSGDREQLSDALAGVLSNALTFTREDGTVSVRVAGGPEDDRVVITVSDTGIGIPPDDLPRLFDSFHRAANAPQALPGAGVGLSIARNTLEDHRGSIRIDSSLGLGTTVVITLPLLDQAAIS
ncbi:ATP-binding protein [Arthrobacter agilis]|uniref:sensor histidine kinase n=1 Tax=Arthrobacter agilis TaxID=37921 RepID=UPI002366F1D8|nr:ATP-binding protein [Arthrobacter agilis]WDF32179.1 ATP-binding protein [Arthrobacter agilis]